jgi:hypothetical protein
VSFTEILLTEIILSVGLVLCVVLCVVVLYFAAFWDGYSYFLFPLLRFFVLPCLSTYSNVFFDYSMFLFFFIFNK